MDNFSIHKQLPPPPPGQTVRELSHCHCQSDWLARQRRYSKAILRGAWHWLQLAEPAVIEKLKKLTAIDPEV
ncbi:MAG: hypothetical protein AAFW84_26630 [Cyanobacteria bacterium J06635_15]